MRKQTNEQIRERDEAVVRLRELCPVGTTIYTVLRHTTACGMSQSVDCYVITQYPYEAKPIISRITWLVATAIDRRFDRKNGGLVVRGGGTDAGFDIAYSLGRVLYPQGFNLVDGMYGRNGDTSGYENDGGYALKNSWL